MSLAISVSDLEIEFPGRAGGLPFRALDRASLSVPKGQFCAIVGPSGCGKSTMLNAVAGLIVPSGGSIDIFGQHAKGFDRRLGYMFQKDTLLPWASALDNVMLPLEIIGRGGAAGRRTAADLLGLVGLRGFETHFPRELSGGMRKRVQLARLLAQEPEILLLDEPFGALDAQTKLVMQQEFLRIWEERRQTVLFVTHDLQEAIALSDRLILMSARPGRIKGDWAVDLPRPRHVDDLLANPVFAGLFSEIWASLKGEVQLL